MSNDVRYVGEHGGLHGKRVGARRVSRGETGSHGCTKSEQRKEGSATHRSPEGGNDGPQRKLEFEREPPQLH